jgi:N utilization substance protein A
VDQSQFSLSIGKRGHNARLTSKLLGWKIDIEVIEKDAEEKLSREMAAEKKAAAQEKPKDASEEIPVQDIAGLSNKVKEYLEEAGYNNLGELKKVQIDELYAIPGVGKSSADDIMDIIRNADKAVQPESKPEAGQESGQESASEADSNSTPEPAPEE